LVLQIVFPNYTAQLRESLSKCRLRTKVLTNHERSCFAKCRQQLSSQWSALCHNRTGRRRSEVVCDVEFLLRNMVCAAGPRFRPGQATFKSNGPGRAGF